VRQDLAIETVNAEERLFRRTLNRGMDLLGRAVARHRATGATVFSGDDCFKLFTTYGFPSEITEELVAAEGLPLDHERFDVCMREHSEVSHAGRKKTLFPGRVSAPRP
jgi:alanyl-tRNA synthetase